MQILFSNRGTNVVHLVGISQTSDKLKHPHFVVVYTNGINEQAIANPTT